MARKKLTDLFVAKVAAPAKGRRVEYFDTTFPALALRVTDSGHKSWSLFYRAGGRLRRWTIGSYPAFDPAAARKAASTALHRLAEGIDPAEEKRARRLAPKAARQRFCVGRARVSRASSQAKHGGVDLPGDRAHPRAGRHSGMGPASDRIDPEARRHRP